MSKCKKNQTKLCGKEDCEICFEKSFASHEKSKYWSDKNIIRPIQIKKTTANKYIFNCDKCNHEFSSGPKEITKEKGTWCPYCCNNILCTIEECKLCYDKSFASHEKSKYWSNLNKLKPREVFKGSNLKYYFDCDKCDHLLEKKLYNVTKENATWCYFCTNQTLCNNNDCEICLKKSFSSHPRSDEWSPKNELSPRQVFLKTSKKFWFKCKKCCHEFEAKIAHITDIKRPNYCPYCNNKKLCNNDCNICFEKSFASHEKSIYWSLKNKESPREILKYSHKEFIFNCDKCSHEFTNTLNRITKINEPTWCKYCANQKLCDDKDCKECFEKSFASHSRSKFWSDKNKLKPREIFKKTSKKYFLYCDNCKIDFFTTINSVAKNYKPSWCPFCKKKTEKKLFDWLKINYKEFIIKEQPNFKWATNKNNRQLPFDFLIGKLNLIIELDGKQHFKKIMNWKDPKAQQDVDIYKMKAANDNNYSIIRILQEDVLYNLNNWERNLSDAIKKYEEPCNIFISNGNEYDVYKEKLEGRCHRF